MRVLTRFMNSPHRTDGKQGTHALVSVLLGALCCCCCCCCCCFSSGSSKNTLQGMRSFRALFVAEHLHPRHCQASRLATHLRSWDPCRQTDPKRTDPPPVGAPLASSPPQRPSAIQCRLTAAVTLEWHLLHFNPDFPVGTIACPRSSNCCCSRRRCLTCGSLAGASSDPAAAASCTAAPMRRWTSAAMRFRPRIAFASRPGGAAAVAA